MKKLWLLLIPLAFSPSLCKGQQKKVLEPALLECHYIHLVKRDTLTENDIHRDSMILRLGKRFTSLSVTILVRMIPLRFCRGMQD